MRTISFATLVFTLIGLMSCGNLVQEVNPDNVPTATAKLVIHSFISPQDTMLVVYVEAPRAVLGTYFASTGYRAINSLPNATVELTDGTQTVRLPAVGGQVPLYYGIDARKFPIVTDRTYTLTVSAPSFPTVKAQCTVPQAVKPTEVQVDSAISDLAQQRGLVYGGRLLWHDPVGQLNFYKVAGYNYRKIVSRTNVGPSGISRDTILSYSFDLNFKSSTLLSDQNKDGQQFISLLGEGSNSQNYVTQSDRLILYQIIMTLSSVDENYYRYQTAIAQQGQAEDNPFAEPVLIPSNIQNGLGCFGAFNQSSLTVRVR